MNSTAQTEYEYFLFKQVYGDKKTFVDAAWDAVKGTNVVQVFTTGNRDFANPYYRPLYPYFSPEAERNWIAVAGLQKDGVGTDGKDTYKWISNFNEAGNAKWWTIAAPGVIFTAVSSTTITTKILMPCILWARRDMPLTAVHPWRRLTSLVL